jgi:hypothetical protein
MPKGKAASIPNEAARQEAKEARESAFKRLAIKRVNKALKALSLIGNLASYKPNISQVGTIERALTDAHNNTIERLKGTAKSVGSFTL